MSPAPGQRHPNATEAFSAEFQHGVAEIIVGTRRGKARKEASLST
jgi:hypothetical protein